MQRNIKKRVLIIEDDVNLGYLLEQIIYTEGFLTSRVKNGQMGLQEIDKNIYSLYIIDIGLPDISGLELVEYIRKKEKETPIIIITDSIEDSKELESFKRKASIFHKKPIRFDLLKTQVNNFLSEESEPHIIKMEGFDILSTNNIIIANDLRIYFTRAEFNLLITLVKSSSRIFSRDDIINRIMDRNKNTTYNSVDTLISRVRRKLKEVDLEDLIITEHSLGYKINERYLKK